MNYVQDFGGGPHNGNCAARAIAITTGIKYEDAWQELTKGVRIRDIIKPYKMNWIELDTPFHLWTPFPTATYLVVLDINNRSGSGTQARHYSSVVNCTLRDEFSPIEVWANRLQLKGCWV